MSAVVKDVAVIGAGLGGLALALALQQRSIPCRVYERRSDYSDIISSGILLYPNGAKVLDALGILDEVSRGCWTTHGMTFLNDKDEKVFFTAGGTKEKHGYTNYRFYRLRLIEVMKARLEKLGISIEYNAKFERVLSESDDGVTFQVSGRRESASLLIGADGIHSAVRKYITPIVPQYTGILCILTHVPASSFKWPATADSKTLTMMGPPGGLMMIPEDGAGTDMLAGWQFEHEDLGRDGWDALGRDPDRMVAYYSKRNGSWTPTQQSLVDSIVAHKEKALIWPFRKLPTLDSWASPKGRVVLIGDAAHTIPPSSGQGVNQALEDAYTLSLLLANANAPAGSELPAIFAAWKSWRVGRIADILRVTAITDAMRATPERRQQLEADGKLEGLLATPEARDQVSTRIFTPDYEGGMAAVLRELQGGKNGVSV